MAYLLTTFALHETQYPWFEADFHTEMIHATETGHITERFRLHIQNGIFKIDDLLKLMDEVQDLHSSIHHRKKLINLLEECYQIFHEKFSENPSLFNAKEQELIERLPDQLAVLKKRLWHLIPARIREEQRGNCKQSVICELFSSRIKAEYQLRKISDGTSGGYFVTYNGTERFVLKVLDEEPMACNSRNQTFFGCSALDSLRKVRKHGPIREVLVYKIAEEMQIADIVPRTELAILQSPDFQLTDPSDPFINASYHQKEKLCSLQEFVPGSISIKAYKDSRAGEPNIDPEDLEKAFILTTVTGDRDAHLGNFLIYLKTPEICGLKKIDGECSNPAMNAYHIDGLMELEQSKMDLSEQGIETILHLNIDHINKILAQYKMEKSIPALEERIRALQAIAARCRITPLTLRQVDYLMSLIGKTLGGISGIHFLFEFTNTSTFPDFETFYDVIQPKLMAEIPVEKKCIRCGNMHAINETFYQFVAHYLDRSEII